MATSLNWYADPDSLLETLRQSRRPAVRTPAITGYRDLQEIKRGGQGVVYSAWQISTKRRVAIKVLAAGAFASMNTRRRFEREIDLAATLDHPHIVRIYDSGETVEGHPYFVMEYIDGVPLDEWPPGPGAEALPPPPLKDALLVFLKICNAVAFAHQRGVIHRDLKPSNIRVDAESVPHVLDFGLAKAVGEMFDGDGATQMSLTGEFMGSLPWASPEQAEGAHDRIDVRTDVYSLGVLLFQLLTRQFPYRVVGPFRTVIDTIIHSTPARPRAVRSDIDDDLETIILKSLEKEPERRYQSAAELARDVRHYLAGEPIEAKRDSNWYTLRKTLRRYRLLVGSAVALVVLSTAVAITTSVLYQRARRAERAAVAAQQQAERDATTAQQVNQLLTGMLRNPQASGRGRDARVSDILDDAARALTANPPTDRVVEAALRDALGVTYTQLGLFEPAEENLNAALEIRAEKLGATAAETLTTKANLAWLKRFQGRYGESEALYREVLADRIERFGENSHEVRLTRNDLANVLEFTDKLDEAERYYRQNLEHARTDPDYGAENLPSSIGNLASVLHTRGEYEEAEALMRERLALTIAHFGENSIDAAIARNNLAILLSDRGVEAEAIELLQQSLATRRALLGPLHPDTITAEQNLAKTYLFAGDAVRAEEYAQLALQHAEAALEPHHPMRILTMTGLSQVYTLTGRAERAVDLDRAVYEARRETLGPQAYDTLQAANALATTLLWLKQFDEAAPLLEEVIAGLTPTLGADHHTVLTVRMNYGHVLVSRGEFSAAIKIAEEVYQERSRQLGPEHANTLLAQLDRANWRADAGAYEAALADGLEVLEIARRVLPADHYFIPIAVGRVGTIYDQAGRAAEAEEYYRTSIVGLTAIFGATNERTNRTRQRLIDLLEKQGRADEAAVERGKLPTADPA